MLVTMAIGCSGRAKQFRQYRVELCACADADCVDVVDHKFASMLDQPSTWVDRVLVSRTAEDEMRADLQEAERCSGKYRASSGGACGVDTGLTCPREQHCEIVTPTKKGKLWGTCESNRHE